MPSLAPKQQRRIEKARDDLVGLEQELRKQGFRNEADVLKRAHRELQVTSLNAFTSLGEGR